MNRRDRQSVPSREYRAVEIVIILLALFALYWLSKQPANFFQLPNHPNIKPELQLGLKSINKSSCSVYTAS